MRQSLAVITRRPLLSILYSSVLTNRLNAAFSQPSFSHPCPWFNRLNRAFSSWERARRCCTLCAKSWKTRPKISSGSTGRAAAARAVWAQSSWSPRLRRRRRRRGRRLRPCTPYGLGQVCFAHTWNPPPFPHTHTHTHTRTHILRAGMLPV